MEAQLIAILLADTGVSTLVGTRIWPGRRQQGGALPAIILNRISGAPIYTNDGETGLERARIQIDCWAKTYPEAKNTARAVQTAISAFAGEESPVRFRNILLDTEQDESEAGSNQAEYLYRTRQDYIVLWNP